MLQSKVSFCYLSPKEMIMHIKVFKKLDVYFFYAFLIIAAAIIFRMVLVLFDWPATNSDEAVMQLMALHINNLGEHPTFFYGQYYMGTIEAYVGAIWFRIFGPSVLIIRFAMISFFAIFLVGLYILTSHLYSRKFALLTIALFLFGTSTMIQHQLATIGGYTEIIPLGVLLLLVSYFLSVSEQPKNRKKQLGLYGLWGLLAGLALWSDLLIAPYILIAGILITLFCWKEIIKWGIWLILSGFCIGAFPLISYNLTAPPGQDSWSTFVALSHAGIIGHYTLWEHTSRTFLISLPIITGFQSNHLVTTWPSSISHPFLHKVLQDGWSVGYLVLSLISLLIGIRTLKAARFSHASRRVYVQTTLHLLLIFAAFLTISLYINGGASITDAVGGARYLMIIWISTPAILWPLWYYGTVQMRHTQKLHFVLTIGRIGITFILFMVLFVSTLNILPSLAPAQKTQQTTLLLTQKLEALHITRFFSEYWTCYPLIFTSQEKLICGNTDPVLQRGYDRYWPYREAVLHTKNPAFVYPVNSNNLADLIHALNTTHTPYHALIYEGYSIIQPQHPIPGVPIYQDK
jgi:hypothetical protein